MRENIAQEREGVVETMLSPVAAAVQRVASLFCLLVVGCTTSEVTKTFVKEATVDGPVTTPPVHIVMADTKNSITMTGFLTLPRGEIQRGYVSGSPPGQVSWLYPVDTLRLPDGRESHVRRVPEYNLIWNLPEVAAGLNLDIAWQEVAVSLGASLSAASGSALFGWSAGLGFFGGDSGSVRVRFDVGLSGQAMSYDASSVSISTSTSSWPFGSTTHIDTAYYHDVRSTSSLGYYGSLSLNSAVEEWPVNVFVQGSCVAQKLLGYTPMTRTTTDWLVPLFLPVQQSSSSEEISTKPVMLGVTPGLYFKPSPSVLLLVGVRFIFDMSDTLLDTGRIVMPFVQVNLSFRR
jgi:hypothetical protein